jgi:hypothetical protein
MKKNIIICFLWTALTAVSYPEYVHGQKLIFIFAHVLYDVPVDSYFKNNYNYGAGVEGGAGIGTGRTFLVGTIGYSSFNTSSRNNSGTTSYVPIKGGIRHYLFVGKILFVNADAGVGLVKNNVINATSFSGDLGLGVKLGPAEILAQYNGYTRSGVENSGYSSWIELKAGVRFGL